MRIVLRKRVIFISDTLISREQLTKVSAIISEYFY